MNREPESTRSHETKIFVRATPEEVWKALTDPEELTRWFPPIAEVRPGKGGTIHYAWGEEWLGTVDIRAWDPPRHLQTGWMNEGAPESRRALAVDYFIETEGGQTVLRVVHSGFAGSSDWDMEYEGTRRGWRHELGGLAVYLERHCGEDRAIRWARLPLAVPVADAWKKLMSPGGAFGAVDMGAKARGERFEAVLDGGETFRGTVESSAPPSDFTAIVDELEGGLFRVGIDACHGGPEAQVWISAWGRAKDAVPRHLERWQARLARALA